MKQVIWQIEMLGGFRAICSGCEPIELSRQQAGMLLAYLALHPNRSHTRESLMALIWPEQDQEEANHRFRQALYRLRKQFEAGSADNRDIFITTRTTIQVNRDLLSIDVNTFQEGVQAASRCKNLREQIALLEAAIGVYRGELLPGFYAEEFETDRRRLAELHRSALRSLMLAYESTGTIKSAIETGNCILALDPLMEEAHCDLMRLYAADGQPASVTRQYQALSAILQNEFAEEPTRATTQLMESLRKTAQINAAAKCDIPATAYPPVGLRELPDSNQNVIPATPSPPQTLRATRSRFALPLAALTVLLCVLVGWGTREARWGRQWRLQPADKPRAAGAVLWTTQLQPRLGDKSSELVAVVPGPDDMTYATGFVDTADHDVDFLTLKYDKDGRLLWQARYNGPGNDLDRAVDIALDKLGFIYVTGESDNGKGNGRSQYASWDFATIKYNGKGEQLWVQRYNGPDDGEDRPVRLLVSDDGVYVLGKSWSHYKAGKEGFDYVLVKYSHDGAKLWVYRSNNAAGDDEPADMALDREGNIYITGQSTAIPASGPERDMLTLKVSKQGAKIWEARYGFGNHCDDIPIRIGVDRGSNVYVIGTGRGLPGTPDADRTGCIVIKYDTNGRREWVRGTVKEEDRIERVTNALVSSEGEVVACGAAHDAAGLPICRVTERDRTGIPRWYADVANVSGNDGPSAVATLPGHVMVCGGLRQGAGDPSFCLFEYDRAGKLRWNHFLAGSFKGGRARAVTTEPYVIAVGQAAYGPTRHAVAVRYQP